MVSYCGYIAIVGRPNVGKSTLLNHLLQQKLSITSRKPQTTRHRILGVHTEGEYQWIYVDTPGIHQGARAKKTMNRLMNKAALSILTDVDAIVFVIDGTRWTAEDEFILQQIQKTSIPCILALNKIDKITDKSILLPFMERLDSQHAFTAVIPMSAKSGVQVDVLKNKLKELLPENPHFFAPDQITDRPIRFLCAELLREKIFRYCGEELPYSTTVDIESFQEEEQVVRIHALILVDKENHKRIIIGNKGNKLKEMATLARHDMEALLGKKVFLQCWCKIKSGWSEDERVLKQLGYDH